MEKTIIYRLSITKQSIIEQSNKQPESRLINNDDTNKIKHIILKVCPFISSFVGIGSLSNGMLFIRFDINWNDKSKSKKEFDYTFKFVNCICDTLKKRYQVVKTIEISWIA
jgi:hypothetical protein